jgi:hypothetical protein
MSSGELSLQAIGIAHCSLEMLARSGPEVRTLLIAPLGPSANELSEPDAPARPLNAREQALGLRMLSLKKISTQSEQPTPMIQEHASLSRFFYFHAGNA